MTVAWRLVKERHILDAFTGDGARLYGGRWNLKGVPVVYVSEHLSLAALEQFVHVSPAENKIRYVFMRIDIPDTVQIEEVNRQDLPADWRQEPVPVSTQEMGSLWAKERRSAVLKLPSVIIPSEYNFMLNPLHPAFREIRIGGHEPFSFDPRMWK